VFGTVAAKVHVAVAEPPAVRLTLEGLQDTVRALDGLPATVTVLLRVTAPEKPEVLPAGRLWRVMTEEAEAPDVRDTELGLGERLKPEAVPPMVKLSEKPAALEGTN